MQYADLSGKPCSTVPPAMEKTMVGRGAQYAAAVAWGETPAGGRKKRDQTQAVTRQPVAWAGRLPATPKGEIMKGYCLVLLAILALSAVSSGCAPLKPASPSMFYGNCITPVGPDPCDSDMAICQVYETVITTKYATAGACRTACNQAFMQLGSQDFAQDCGYMFDRGCDLCEQECLRQYPGTK